MFVQENGVPFVLLGISMGQLPLFLLITLLGHYLVVLNKVLLPFDVAGTAWEMKVIFKLR